MSCFRRCHFSFLMVFIIIGFIFVACKIKKSPDIKNIEVLVEAEHFLKSNVNVEILNLNSKNIFVESSSEGWIALDVDIPVAGRYKSQIKVSSLEENETICWIEDYYDNKNNRTYNITGNIVIRKLSTYRKDGSPLNKGLHKIKLHFNGCVRVDWIKFTLLKESKSSPKTFTQKTNGSQWKIVWADEFDSHEIDNNKWSYDIGNWGWANEEQQYYTEDKKENARIENGNLIIEARRNDKDNSWTSARLTTRGKTSFLYGKIEFRAKVPYDNGYCASGWLLGDDYIDEISWPYCGEIDVFESIGYKRDYKTGKSITNASAHSIASCYKSENQSSNTMNAQNICNNYHTYAVEWTPSLIKVSVDNNLYFTYSDTKSDLSWPFNKPQNIVLNLAIRRGLGGYNGFEDNINSQKMIIDYVRVYERY